MEDTTHIPRWLFVAMLLLTLLIAAGLRLYRLPDLPLGLHYDEAANGILAGEIAGGAKLPVFIPSYTGKEVLFFYWAAFWMKLLGVTPLALRLSAALVGLATVAATYWAVCELLYGCRGMRWSALFAAAFLATSFWHLVLSRYGFRAVTQPLMQALTVAALWRGLRLTCPHLSPSPSPLPQPGEGRESRRRRQGWGEGLPWLILAGLLCGLTAYTYLAARAFPIPLAAALLTLLVADWIRRRARLRQMALFVLVATLILAPLAYYWWTHPGSFMTRAGQVAAASWAEAWDGILDCLKMFFITGDPYIRFNIPFRPIFGPVTAALFIAGVGIVVLRICEFAGLRVCRFASLQAHDDSPNPSPLCSSAPLQLASRVFLFVYLPTMLLPSALAAGEITPSNLRAAGLLPFVYVFPALGLSTLQSLISNLTNRQTSASASRRFFVICHLTFAILILVVLTPFTAAAYFGDWAVSPALYYAADGDMAAAAAYLNGTDLAGTTLYVASIHYEHPTLAFLAEDYGAIHRLTGGRTVVFPAEGDALLVFPHSASEDLAWIESVLPDDVDVDAGLGPDGEPAFHVYRVRSGSAPPPTRPLDANFSHIVRFLGYDVVGQARSGEGIELAVWWRVLNEPPLDDYRPVARLVDPWGNVWGERLPFHYISKEWEPGEVIVDHLSIPGAPGTPPGEYDLHFGLYSANADQRLGVLDDDGRHAGTTVELPVRMERAAVPTSLGELGIRNRLDARADGLMLLGVNLETAVVRPGEPLFLSLFWRAEESPLPDYDVTLGLGDVVLYEGAPVHDTYPISDWLAGEAIVDRYGLRLPRDMPAGEHTLSVEAGDLSIDLGIVIVQATERLFDVPPISHSLDVNLGDQVELLGYDLAEGSVSPGEALALTLYWRALREMNESYTVFAHVVAADGLISGQKDNPPVGGNYPTDLWLPGEVVVDVYAIPIAADAVVGEHTLEVGMYVADSGARLPIVSASADAVVLQTITIGE
jgi:4-amino-4-deoxy-L-arabinose transferase-like glycosyltransferase